MYGSCILGHAGYASKQKIDANIAYFIESIKPMVLNATNSKQIKLFTGSSFVQDWINVKVELYIDEHVQMKGITTQGVRIRPVQPREKQKPTFTEINFDKAKKANATREMIEKVYFISDGIYKSYLSYEAKE